MTKKSTTGRGGKAEPATAASRRAVPPPPAGLPLMPRLLEMDEIREGGITVPVTATEAERLEIAKAMGIPAVASLSAEYRLTKHGRRVYVAGDLKARVTQVCVVTLEPFETDISEKIDMRYAPPSDVAEAWAQLAREEANGNSTPTDDPPDVLVEGKVDLGALTTEVLSLALDPYPKKPGVAFEAPEADPEEAAADSPFSALARLRGQGGPGSSSAS
jgi:uncharacterized metal-binding protein YceD (DUF177 family)